MSSVLRRTALPVGAMALLTFAFIATMSSTTPPSSPSASTPQPSVALDRGDASPLIDYNGFFPPTTAPSPNRDNATSLTTMPLVTSTRQSMPNSVALQTAILPTTASGGIVPSPTSQTQTFEPVVTVPPVSTLDNTTSCSSRQQPPLSEDADSLDFGSVQSTEERSTGWSEADGALPVPRVEDPSSWRSSVRLTAPQWAHAIKYLWSKVIVSLAGALTHQVPRAVPHPLDGLEPTYSIYDVYDACHLGIWETRLVREATFDRLEAIRLRFARRRMLPIVYIEMHLLKPFIDTIVPEYERRMKLTAEQEDLRAQTVDNASAWSRFDVTAPSNFSYSTPSSESGGSTSSTTRMPATSTSSSTLRPRIVRRRQYPPLVILTHCRDPGPRFVYRSTSNAEAEPRAKRFHDSLDSPVIHRWFMTNCDQVHPKVECMPLGFAFHDSLEHNIHPATQANRILFASRMAKSNLERRPLHVFLDGWSDHTNPFRKSIRDHLRAAGGHQFEFAAGRRSVDETFAAYQRAAFVLAPPGGGIDCHRVAESIVLGAIPILWNASRYRQRHEAEVEPHFPAAEFQSEERNFDKLPVVFADDYRSDSLTTSQLEIWQQDVERRRRAGGYDLRRLTNVFWMKRLFQVASKGHKQWLRDNPKMQNDKYLPTVVVAA